MLCAKILLRVKLNFVEDSNGMKRLKYLLLIFGLVVCGGLVAFVPSTSVSADALSDACDGAPNSALCLEMKKTGQFEANVKIIVNTLLYVLGAVSVIVIIVAGILYTTSGGDPALITKAKNTLLYAVIGLVVAISAYAIVNFVIDQFK